MNLYQTTLDFMFKQLPMYQRQGKSAFKKDLTNIVALLSHLGNPHQQFKSIHIGGTNGKGTTTHIIAGALQGHGLKVGVYTSPHYKDFRERIKINGQFISEQSVIDFVEDNKAIIEEIQPSFFEITVAMAFQHFAQEKVDVAVIEVGLGGRLDSTNVITPLLSIITNISMDHTSMLGNTLPEIAGEKAGIIKSSIPVVIGEYQESVAEVFADKAKEKNAQITFASQQDIALEGYHLLPDNAINRKNLKTALVALNILKDSFDLDDHTIKKSIQDFKEKTYYIGRYQVLGNSPTIMADSAHNFAGLKNLMDYIHTQRFTKLHIVVGFASDKDVEGVKNLFPRHAQYYFTQADIPRAMDASILSKYFEEYQGNIYNTSAAAYADALATAREDDFVLICGSIFLVAEII